jgi:hypothetical protein
MEKGELGHLGRLTGSHRLAVAATPDCSWPTPGDLSRRGAFSMDRVIEVWESEGGSHGWVASRVAQSTRNYHALWIGVLYAITIGVILTVVVKLY